MKTLTKQLAIAWICMQSMCAYGQENDTLEMHRNNKGKITFARFKPSANRKMQDGERFLQNVLKAKAGHDFVLLREMQDEIGMTHKRYGQYYKGLRVENAEYILHGKTNSIETMNGDFQEVTISSVSPTISESDALSRALNYINAKKYKWQDANMEKFVKTHTNNANATYYPKGELVISKDDLKKSGNLRLSWKFTISSLEPNNEQLIYVDANNGDVIGDVPLISDANVPCTAQTRYSGIQAITGDSYTGGNRLREVRTTTAGNTANIVTLNIQNGSNYANAIDFVNTTTNFTSGNWAAFNQDQAALDVHWGIERVLDYWATVHQRNSIDGLGLQATNYVHYNDPSSSAGWPNNAQWDATARAMFFGDGDGVTFNPIVALDVTAHELGHGINQFTANLTPGRTESGALNEGFSDIWGASVENWGSTGKQTWRIGEELFKTTTFNCIRDLQNPKSSAAAEGQHPDTYRGQFWDNLQESHNNSTVLSHWFYLISQGGSGTNDNNNTYSVSGIGIASARRIAFRAESIYLTPTSKYSDARTAMITAARDLFCDNSQEVAAVTNAWYAVGVGTAYTGTVPSLIGADLICTSQSFTVQNPIAGSTTTWSTSNANGLTISTSGLAVRVNNYNGVVNVSTTFAGAGGCSTVVTKAIAVGSGLSDPLFEQKTVVCPTSEYSIVATVNQAAGSATYKWYIGSSSGTNFVLKATTTSNSATVPGGTPDNLFRTLKVDIINQCSNSLVSTAIPEGRFRASCSGGGGTLSFYPNPATTDITIEYATESDNQRSSNDSPAEFSVVLFDSFGQKRKQGNSISSKVRIDVGELPRGVYYLHVYLNDEVLTKRVLVNQ